MKEEILSRLDAIAVKMGVATEHLYAVMVRQGRIEGYYSLVYVGLLLALIVTCVLFMRASFKRLEAGARDDPHESIIVGGAVVALLSAVGIVFCVGDTKYLFNPEMFAIEQITKMVRG